MDDLSIQTPVRPTPGPPELIDAQDLAEPLEFLGGLIQRYGDTLKYRTKYGEVYLFTHPAHVHSILHRENYRRASLVRMVLGEGLLATDGPRWREHRRLMQRDFHASAIEPFVRIMTDESQVMVDEWAATAASGGEVDLSESMTRLTLRVVVKSLFSEQLPRDQEAALCNAVTESIYDLGAISWTVFGVPMMFTPQRNEHFRAAMKIIDDTCLDMVARRRASQDRPDDLLSLLVEADTEAGPLTDIQLRDEMVTMLVGGHETTALALAWAWKLLAEHPDVEARMHDELRRVLGGRPPTLKDVSRLRWTSAVFNEAMRLYPPVWYMARVACEDDVIDGHAVPKGACVLVSAWFTHRHPQFWPDAERFDPSRFIEEQRPGERYALFPFGGGRHQCLGIHFARLEGVVVLAHLAQHLTVRPTNGDTIRPNPGITLRQTPNLMGRVEPHRT